MSIFFDFCKSFVTLSPKVRKKDAIIEPQKNKNGGTKKCVVINFISAKNAETL